MTKLKNFRIQHFNESRCYTWLLTRRGMFSVSVLLIFLNLLLLLSLILCNLEITGLTCVLLVRDIH